MDKARYAAIRERALARKAADQKALLETSQIPDKLTAYQSVGALIAEALKVYPNVGGNTRAAT